MVNSTDMLGHHFEAGKQVLSAMPGKVFKSQLLRLA